MREHLTYADLREMPEDGWRYELLEGDIVGSPAPTVRHQRIVMKITALLLEAEKAGAGIVLTAPTDVVFDPDLNALQPDLLFISRARAAYLLTDTHIAGPPDLVVEVVSGRSVERDLATKPRVYARYGVAWYWAVDPEAETLRVFELEGQAYRRPVVLRGDDVLVCPLLPSVCTRVADLFGGL
jgi:Uma2 family endonuclease